jgi:hypothetical protein
MESMPTPRKIVQVRQSCLQDLWLVDTVLKRNVCPLGHKTQRIGDFLAALYAFHKKYWFSAPQLIWSQMFKCWEDKVDKGLLGPNRPALPFPFLVTKLVLSKGLALSDTDFLTYESQVFGYAQWKHSISHLPRRVPAGEQDAEMEDAAAEDQPAAEMAEGEPSVQGRVPLSHTEYELLQAELEKIHKRQEDFEKRMGDTLQEILSRLPPAPPAP